MLSGSNIWLPLPLNICRLRISRPARHGDANEFEVQVGHVAVLESGPDRDVDGGARNQFGNAALCAIIPPDLAVPFQDIPELADGGVKCGFINMMRWDGAMDHIASGAIHQTPNSFGDRSLWFTKSCKQ